MARFHSSILSHLDPLPPVQDPDFVDDTACGLLEIEKDASAAQKRLVRRYLKVASRQKLVASREAHEDSYTYTDKGTAVPFYSTLWKAGEVPWSITPTTTTYAGSTLHKKLGPPNFGGSAIWLFRFPRTYPAMLISILFEDRPDVEDAGRILIVSVVGTVRDDVNEMLDVLMEELTKD